MPAVEQPRRIPDDEEYERVAAIDVAKGAGVVCTRVPDEDRPGRRKRHVRTVRARTGAAAGLGDYLRARQIRVITPEPASGCRRIWYLVLEAAGLKVQVVSARAVKNVPGRAETGEKDAVWPARLTGRGMLQPSFVPPDDIRRLREFARLRAAWCTARAGTGPGWRSCPSGR